MRCATCKLSDDEMPAAGWVAHFPKQVVADFSRFIDCAPIFSRSGVFRCYNCGTYLCEVSGATECLEFNDLEQNLLPSLCDGFAAVLAFPPDLLRVATNELRLGNEAASMHRTDAHIDVLVFRYRFFDGHLVSSWVEYQDLPKDKHWGAWYLCPTAQNAIACGRLSR